jgi:lysophospholipase L1-like esterase
MSQAIQPMTRVDRGSRWRRFARWLGRMAIVSIVIIGLTEATLWVIAPQPFDEWLVYVPDGRIRARAEPNQVVRKANGAEVRINRLGFRGPDYAWEPAPGTLRLLAFGGSSTFCWQSSTEEATWPARLQHYLADALKMSVEVINLGMADYDATQTKCNYMFLGRALHPHVVLEYDGWNDMKFFRLLERAPDTFTYWIPNKPWWQKIMRAAHIGRRVRNAWWKYTRRKLEIRLPTLEKEGVSENRPVVEYAYEWARRNFEDFVRLAKADGVLPVLISQGMLLDVSRRGEPRYEEEFADSAATFGMSFPVFVEAATRMNRIVKDVAEKNDVIFVDGLEAVPRDFDHYQDGVHFNDQGSDVFARAVADALLRDPRFAAVVDRVRGDAAAHPSVR